TTLHKLVLTAYFLLNSSPPTTTYTLSLHDALPISRARSSPTTMPSGTSRRCCCARARLPTSTPRRRSATVTRSRSRAATWPSSRSEEHTSELQSQSNLVCRLLLEKKKGKKSCYCRL